MGSRFVRPETTVLNISNGDTLTVRRRLSTGEQRAAFARMYLANSDGDFKVNPIVVGPAMILSYLVDWTLTDETGAVVPIRGASLDELASILDTLDTESFAEIRVAIEQHDAAIRIDREEKKTIPTGANGSGPISDSPLPLDGPSAISTILTPTNTRN